MKNGNTASILSVFIKKSSRRNFQECYAIWRKSLFALVDIAKERERKQPTALLTRINAYENVRNARPIIFHDGRGASCSARVERGIRRRGRQVIIASQNGGSVVTRDCIINCLINKKSFVNVVSQ